eukprot:g2205.t1
MTDAQKVTAKKAFVNNPEDVVPEAIEGLLELNPELLRVEGQNVVVRRDYEQLKAAGQVALVSGGGSGHEPGMGGFVGPGMLTAAVAGGVFASPSVEAILAAVRVVTGPAGCLLIIMNYTGDRLNFGLAMEQAKQEGLRVEMVIVGDDVALNDRGVAGRRGVAGTCFVHKIAGGAAAGGAPLAGVLAEAGGAAASVATMGIGLTSCTLPGQPQSQRVAAGDMEVGLGIHGEPGAATTAAGTAGAAVGVMVRALCQGAWADTVGLRAQDGGARLAVLVNNAGATPWLEALVLAREAAAQLRAAGHTVERLYCGHFLTSLDMAGAALAVYRLDGARGGG